MRLTHLRRGSDATMWFSIAFGALAGETAWSQGPLILLFLNTFSDPLRAALAVFKPPASFDALFTAAINIEN